MLLCENGFKIIVLGLQRCSLLWFCFNATDI